jgi:RecA-family ATPase
MTTSKYADEEAAAEESGNHTYDPVEEAITNEYIRIKAQARARQRIRDEKAIGFAAEFASKIVDAADIVTPDQQPYLVKKLIYLPGVTMLHSDPGVGKSICAMDLAFRVGLGLAEWCGYKIKRQVRVLYVFSEGVARLWKRRDAWLKKHGYAVDDLRGKVDFYTEPIPLNASEAYVDAVVKHAKRNGYGLIVIDTWATANAGSDENAAGLMQQSLNRCGRIRDEVQAGVLVVHHDNRQGAFRGSSVIDGYLDTRLHAVRDGDRDDRRVAVTVEKQRDDEDGITWMAQLEVVDLGVDEDGDSITSVVWTHLPDATPNSKREGGVPGGDRVGLHPRSRR